ncbi:MAG TPA: CpXC domain-containing protein [Acetobacteraceae bacterium]|nr:CpXC domain-containing protein [Acetobacteraceae bacterium]
MSIFLTATATCPVCQATTEVELSASVNADRRPDLRDAILDGSFQAATCPKCASPMRLPARITYLDVGRGQWILMQSADTRDDWAAEETAASGVYDETFGAEAPEFSREIGADLRPRLVFGWPALREKLLCQQLGLDDVTLELLKIAVMRDVPGAPISDATELRLVGGDDTQLDFAWFNALSEERLASLEVPRDAYDSLEEEPEGWDSLRANFKDRMFVDLRRITAA